MSWTNAGTSRRLALALLSGAAGFPAIVWAEPRRAAPAPAARRPVLRTIVLDPGHGGPDPGTSGGTGIHEKAIVMTVARLLERELVGSGRYKVLLTRSSDQFVALRERVQRARAAKGELFVSLHADSHPNAATRGASVYTLSEQASDREAAALAARENKADIVAGVDFSDKPREVASVLLDLTQRGTINHSRLAANLAVDALQRRGVGLLPRTHRQAGFAVLTAPDIPAILVELGYLSNRYDEQLLKQPIHQQRLALGIMDAADRFFAAVPPSEPAPAWPVPRPPVGPGGGAAKKA